MDDLQAWIPQSIGEAGDGNTQPPSAQQSNPEPSEISAESWRRAEQATQEVIKCIQPTVISEQRRRAVVEYVQKLIRWNLRIEVILLLIFLFFFRFGVFNVVFLLVLYGSFYCL